jgi:two-component system NarL family sensor kinase
MGSGLTSLLFMSRAPGAGADRDEAGDHATIVRMQQTAEQLIRKMNDIVWTLSHDQDSLESLVAYIRSNTAELLGQAGIDVHFEIDEDLPDKALTQEFRRNVYLVVKEAVHNIVRHSEASVAEIGVHLNGWELTVVVQDNGKGIYKAGGNRWGNGMKNMQRRVEQVGGRMEITAGGGTEITIVAPLPQMYT